MRGLPQHRLVPFLGFEESERIHQDGGAEGPGSKWQSPHVASNPTSMSGKVGTQLLGPRQEGDREVHARDLRSALRQCEGMPPMATANINDFGTRRKAEEVPKTGCFEPNMI